MARKSATAESNGSNSSNGKEPPCRSSDRLLKELAKAERVTFVSHVHPDPDSLGSMLGLAYLVEERLDKPTRLLQDGVISRAENRAMVDLLDIELVPLEEADWSASGEAVVMVDSQPNTGRHNLDPCIPISAVLDHHDTPGDLEGVPFVDIQHHLGATCSLVTNYLIEQHLPPPLRVATALFYGIETELGGYPREACSTDDSALHYLYPMVDKDLIARIRNARLPQRYFGCLIQALQSSFVYDRLIISWVNDLPQPELAAEVVDFLIRFEEVDWAVCAGVCRDQLILSVRATRADARAGDMLRRVVQGMGRAGGHDRRAGGSVFLPSTSAHAVEHVQAELRRRLLRALNIEECRGHRLVSRKEMLQNLHG